MKIIFVSLLLLVSIVSCQSEYQRQMEAAITHKRALETQKENLEPAKVKALQEQIYFCAEMSGSKATFLEDLESKQ